MARAYSDDAIHVESLAALAGDSAAGPSLADALEFGLGRIADRVRVDGIEFGDARWTDRGWSRRATVVVADMQEADATAQFSVEVPWLTGVDAALQSRPGLSIGGHVGTFWGRERFPVTVYVHAPGVHYIVRQLADDRSYRALLAPELGTTWSLERGREPQQVKASHSTVIPFLRALSELDKHADQDTYLELAQVQGLRIKWGPDTYVSALDQAPFDQYSDAERAEIKRKLERQLAQLRKLRRKVRKNAASLSPVDYSTLLAKFPAIWTLRGVPVVKLRGRGLTLPDEDAVYDRDLLLAGDEEVLARIASITGSTLGHTGGGQWDDPELQDILRTLEDLAITDSARDAHTHLPAAKGSDSKTAPRLTIMMDPSNWQASGYGEQLVAAAALAVSRAARSIAKFGPRSRRARTNSDAQDRPIDLVAAQLRGVVQRAIVDVVAGRDAHPNATVVERPINTLGLVEVSRQRTFLGPRGLESYDGRLDLRVQPAGWRKQLCPVQTPESEKIGFVRYLAIDKWDVDEHAAAFRERWGGDLSLAASLVPYIDHDDPTRIALGAKMFKQAVVLENADPPLVRTGAERLVGEAGVVRAQTNGAVSLAAVDRGVILVGRSRHAFGAVKSPNARQDDRWQVLVEEGDLVSRGTILAMAPDVQESAPGSKEPLFAFGRTARVAFMPWKGWNVEDGMVVSKSFAEKMESRHTITLSAEYDFEHGEMPWPVLEREALTQWHDAGVPVMRVGALGETAPTHVYTLPERFRVLPVAEAARSLTEQDQRAREFTAEDYIRREQQDDGTWVASVRFEVRRPLQIGDKLTTRHGGKGVVTLVLDDAAMPRLPDGSVVEVILNPLGVLRRLNIGTFIELHEGLAATLEAQAEGAPVCPVIAERRLGSEGRAALDARLSNLGVPGGRQVLKDAQGKTIGSSEGVLAGPLYLVKLDHLARNKGGARDDSSASPLTFQPLRSSGWRANRKLSAPQRLGEMEVWSLDALGARRLVDDLFDDRGVGEPSQRNLPARRQLLPSGFRAVLAHLAVGGVHVEAVTSDGEARDLTAAPLVGLGGERLRVVRNDGSDLRDVIQEFEAAKGEVSTPSPAIAKLVLEWVLNEAVPSSTEADSTLARQLVHFAIPLPIAVEHPWKVKSKMFGTLRMPAVTHLALLPASLLDNRKTAEWGGLRQRYERVVQLTLELRRYQASEFREGLTSAIALTEKQLTRAVQEFLGWVSDKPADDSVAGRLSRKFGLMRRNMLGAASVRSGRAVLVGDPELDAETVRLPGWMADAIGVPLDGGTGYGDVVIVNRQPTLHPYNLLALRATRWNEDAVALNPILLAMIAGDFDGDTVAVHRPDDERAREEAWGLRRPSAALRSGAAGQLLAKLDLDVALGQVLSGTADDADGVQAAAEKIVATEPLDPKRVLDRLVDFAGHGFEKATGWSPSVIDRGARASLAKAVSAEAIKAEDIPTLFERRGDVVLPAPELAAPTIEQSYLDGLTEEDYFAAAQQAVAGIAAKKLVTPFAGALTRRLVRRGYELVVVPDCGAYEGHTPLACTEAGICEKGFRNGQSSGLSMAAGARVGIQSALFIGERATQKALKSIHVRGKNGLLLVISELAALLGAPGGITLPAGAAMEGASTTFVKVLRWSWAQNATLEPARELLRSLFVERLDGQVDPVHLEVLLYPVWSSLAEALSEADRTKEEFTRTDVDSAFASVRHSTAISSAAWAGDLGPIVKSLNVQPRERLAEGEHEPVFMATLRNFTAPSDEGRR